MLKNHVCGGFYLAGTDDRVETGGDDGAASSENPVCVGVDDRSEGGKREELGERVEGHVRGDTNSAQLVQTSCKIYDRFKRISIRQRQVFCPSLREWISPLTLRGIST